MLPIKFCSFNHLLQFPFQHCCHPFVVISASRFFSPHLFIQTSFFSCFLLHTFYFLFSRFFMSIFFSLSFHLVPSFISASFSQSSFFQSFHLFVLFVLTVPTLHLSIPRLLFFSFSSPSPSRYLLSIFSPSIFLPNPPPDGSRFPHFFPSHKN